MFHDIPLNVCHYYRSMDFNGFVINRGGYIQSCTRREFYVHPARLQALWFPMASASME